jgi:hypothetical protein
VEQAISPPGNIHRVLHRIARHCDDNKFVNLRITAETAGVLVHGENEIAGLVPLVIKRNHEAD